MLGNNIDRGKNEMNQSEENYKKKKRRKAKKIDTTKK